MDYPLADKPVYDDAEAFVKDLNAARRKAGKRWIAYLGMVARKEVRIKSYGASYLQILTVDGIKHPVPMDTNVTEWLAAIRKALGV